MRMKYFVILFLFVILYESVKSDLADCIEICGGKLIFLYISLLILFTIHIHISQYYKQIGLKELRILKNG
jgi:hypothetical protein